MAVDASRVFKPINIAVLTVSDTRTSADDTSGDILAQGGGRGPLPAPSYRERQCRADRQCARGVYLRSDIDAVVITADPLDRPRRPPRSARQIEAAGQPGSESVPRSASSHRNRTVIAVLARSWRAGRTFRAHRLELRGQGRWTVY